MSLDSCLRRNGLLEGHRVDNEKVRVGVIMAGGHKGLPYSPLVVKACGEGVMIP